MCDDSSVAALLLVLAGVILGTVRLVRSREHDDSRSLIGHDRRTWLGQADERPSVTRSVAVTKFISLVVLGVVAVLVVVMLWLTFAVDWPAD